MIKSEIVTRTQDWPYKRRVLLHAFVEHTAIIMFSYNGQKHHQPNEYEKFAYDVIKGYKEGMSLKENSDNLFVADNSLDELIGRSMKSLVDEVMHNPGKAAPGASSMNYFLITLSMASRFIPVMADAEVDELLNDLKELPDSLFVSPKIIQWSQELHDKGMKALEDVMEEMDQDVDVAFEDFGEEDDLTIQERIGYDTYSRILKGFPREDDEPSSISTIFCPVISKFSPSDPEAYYKRKMREPFKVIEKHKDDVRDDDYWGLLMLLRSALHRAASDFDTDEYNNHSLHMTYNLVVEFTTGFSKGSPRQHYDANPAYRAKLNSLLNDAIQLMLFFLEDYSDDMVIKVHRRFRLLESKMKPLGFEPYCFELVYDYVNSRLL